MCYKNFLFPKSVTGAEASAVIVSVLKTVKGNDIEVRTYQDY